MKEEKSSFIHTHLDYTVQSAMLTLYSINQSIGFYWKSCYEPGYVVKFINVVMVQMGDFVYLIDFLCKVNY